MHFSRPREKRSTAILDKIKLLVTLFVKNRKTFFAMAQYVAINVVKIF